MINDFIGKIHNEDCIELIKRLPDESVNVILTDPPFGNSNHVGDLNSKLNELRGLENKPIANDTEDSYKSLMHKFLQESIRICTKDCAILCFCGGGGGSPPMFSWLANRMDSDGLKFCHAVIWDKNNPGLGWKFRRGYEFIMVAHREDGKLTWDDSTIAIPNIIKCSKPRNGFHPNEKPVELISKLLVAITKPEDVILDSFCGGGSVLLACERLKRRWIGCELESKYCEVSNSRIAEERKNVGLF